MNQILSFNCLDLDLLNILAGMVDVYGCLFNYSVGERLRETLSVSNMQSEFWM